MTNELCNDCGRLFAASTPRLWCPGCAKVREPWREPEQTPPSRARPNRRQCHGCGALTISSRHWYCAGCRAKVPTKRSQWTGHTKSRQERGYGPEHYRTRRQWEPLVKQGWVTCNICGRLIVPGTAWHLSHPYDDKALEPAPAHASCNTTLRGVGHCSPEAPCEEAPTDRQADMVTDQLSDPGLENLVRVLDEFPGISAFGPSTAEEDPRLWSVDFWVERTNEGHMSLEFMAWCAYDWAPEGVILQALAKSPHNRPGDMLFYRWINFDPDDPKCTPGAIAILLAVWKREAYITADEAASWTGV